MNKEITRLQFSAGLIGVSTVVFCLLYYIAMYTQLRIANLIIIGSIFPIVFLVRLREKNIQPRFRWRIWYTLITSFLLAISVTLMFIPSTTNGSIAYKEAQTVSGFFFFFLILTLPVFLSCIFQKGDKNTSNFSLDNEQTKHI